ncbi:SH3 domain-containing protein (plasmid) [Pseudorhodobacter turbinis]|uniref:SH3 domain-containing protein n=1 Tax=Pseudorhodobacter turbinis TaxID=2500533 RepID=A0A4P8EL58_9RHOB|nr:SH3 domain-containing protein [Pseudorhodobacter turbinis]QCO57622.1 SH3 domain-containing protein [Pseudorhodobacter turbinis]
MHRTILLALALTVLATIPGPRPAVAATLGYYEVFGVEGEDMLKMRAGPGIGYNIILGLPNGTVLRVYSCEQTGGTRWCKVSLKEARGVKGYVSWAYLRES